jgi:pilus assembly protein FimV
MHLSTRSKSVSFSLQTLSAAVLSALLFANASAAGLGKLTVISALGQPLHAEVEITSATKDEVGLLMPKLASIDAFRQANIDFNPALYSLRFAVEQRDGRPIISVTSTQPINEPFVDMLLELGGNGSGRLVREYTFLLDPVDLHAAQAPEVVAARALAPARSSQEAMPARSQQAAAASEPPQRVAQVPRAPLERPARPVVSEPAVSDKKALQQSNYRVKNGDSLSKISGQLKPDGISLDQMLVAMFRANQGAFVGNNMNRLRAGQVLSVPDASSAGAVSDGEARGIVVAQAADFNEYRNKLAGRVAQSEPQKSSETRQSGSGKITAKIEEKSTVAAESKDKLKLSSPGPAASEKGGRIALGEEDKIAKDKAVAEANARVKELEKNVSDLQKILEIKSKNIADQQKVEAAKAAAKPAAPIAAAPAIPAPTAPTPAAAPTSAAKEPAVKTEPVGAVAPPRQPLKPKPTPVPPPETGFFDDPLGNPFMWGGAALLLLGAGIFGIYSGYRRRKEKSFGDSILADSSLKANSLFGSTGGQSVDTNNSVFNSNFAPSASQLDSNEVDPVAEADVYIAYGRDAQAEEILKEALRTQPDRHAVRVKLLEIYANRKDVRSFEVLASELYGLTKGQGEDWRQAAILGASLDPKNPLYAGGKLPEEVATKALAMTAPTRPLDERDMNELNADTLEESSYVDSTTLGEQPDTVVSHSDELTRDTSTSLDFDLDGMDVDTPEVAGPAAALEADNKMDFGNIDFDFDKQETPAEPPAHDVEHSVDFPVSPPSAPAVSDLEFEIPHFPEVPMIAEEEVPVRQVAPLPESVPAPLDFDLSGITLELNPSESHPAGDHGADLHVPDIHVPDIHALDMHAPDSHAATETALPQVEPLPEILPDLTPYQHAETDVELDTGIDHEYSNSAEMATKLDLAVAYQEIGDKEGARELLDEVIGGGTPEQSERAKSLLAKLG